jgi:hypothetical protein
MKKQDNMILPKFIVLQKIISKFKVDKILDKRQKKNNFLKWSINSQRIQINS